MHFLIDILPYWVIVLTMAISSGLILISFLMIFPVVSQYRTPIQVVSITILAFSLWIHGFKYNEEFYQDKIKQIETQNKIFESESERINTVVQYKYIDRPKTIIETKTKDIIKKIPVYITEEVESECKIPQEFIIIHNEAVRK